MRVIASCGARILFSALLGVCPPLAAGSTYGKLPLSFEPNQGQTDARVKFLSRASGYTLFVTSDEAVFAGRAGSVELMKFVGAKRSMRIEPLERQPGISNYFIGNDPSKWRTNIPNYGRVTLRGVYPGIDLIFYGNERQLEYDWVVSPGADPKQIRVKWEGPSRVTKNASGDLVLNASLVQKKPVILQEGKRIEGGYVLRGREVAFELAKYDTKKPLVIDPVLVYSTYLGGSGDDGSSAIAVDGLGNALVTGRTRSTNFPTTNPLQASNREGYDAFVTKIKADGSAKVYSTYLGGDGEDRGEGIAVDGSGNAYVTGFSASIDFPTANPLQASNPGGSRKAFVTKINATGSALVYSTYLGGSGIDSGNSIAVDGSGDAYVTGFTYSTNFPTANPLQASHGGGFNDAFVTKINATGSALIYSTYLGGSGSDSGNSIAVDGSGNAYVTGDTTSTNFPTTNPLQASRGGLGDAFVTKINAAGSAVVYSTYLGGSGDDRGNGIAVDGSGNAYVTGDTTSTNFPITNPLQASHGGGFSDAFVTKINATGSALIYSTYLGGSGGDSGNGIAVDGSGNAYVTGQADSPDFPTTDPLQATFGGFSDVFVTKINGAGSALVYSAYLGGSDDEGGVGIAVDSSGNAYVTGGTTSRNFPTTNPLQTGNGGFSDAFVVAISAAVQTGFVCTNTAIPVITSINSAADFGGFSSFAPGSWLEIKGVTLSQNTRDWTGAFNGDNAPTKLDGVSAKVNGKDAAIYYVSPGQINVQAPADTATGPVPITVTNCNATSSPTMVTEAALVPGMLAPSAFNVAGKQYLAALFLDGVTFVGNTGLIAGAPFRPAKPGDVITAYGVGFGSVTPSIAPGVIVRQANSLASAPFSISFGSTPATVTYDGLYPSFIGLYEFYITVPDVADGDYQINVTAGGVNVPQTVFLTVHK